MIDWTYETGNQTHPVARGGDDDDTSAFAFAEVSDIDAMYLTFSVGDEEYGLPIAAVTEVVGMQRIMEVPDVPKFIRGVINLRGKVIPVMDMRTRFHLQERAYHERTAIIVLEVEAVPLGLAVDAMGEVLEIPDRAIERPPQFGATKEGKGIVSGLGRSGDRIVILIDAGKIASEHAVDMQRDLRVVKEIRASLVPPPIGKGV